MDIYDFSSMLLLARYHNDIAKEQDKTGSSGKALIEFQKSLELYKKLFKEPSADRKIDIYFSKENIENEKIYVSKRIEEKDVYIVNAS